MTYTITRPPRTDPPGGQGLRAGAARVDLTPALGVGLAGHGPTANAAQGFFGRLYASILIIEDDSGARVALIAADLHAGSRYLCERLGAQLADEGLTVDRVVLAASHTHRGPASILGNASYDRLTGPAWAKAHWDAHFDRPLADALADRLEAGVRAVLGPPNRTPDLVTLRPCALGLAAPTVWGWLTNRSAAAADGWGSTLDPDDFLAGVPPRPTETEVRAMGARLTGSAPPAWIGQGAPPGAPAFAPGALSADPPGPPPLARPVAPPAPRPGTLDELLRRVLGEGDLRPVTAVLADAAHAKVRPLPREALDAARVDARIHVLVAREVAPTGRGVGEPIGAFAALGATPSLLGPRHAVFCADAVGWAARAARERLEIPFPFGIAGGALGDANLVPRGAPLAEVRKRGRSLDGATDLVREVGAALADALVHALRDQPLAHAEDLRLELAFEEVDPASAGLDPRATLGVAGLGGSDLATSPFAAVIREGLREDPPPAGAQSPKVLLPPLEVAPSLPLRRVRLRSPSGPWWTLLAMPVEVSAALGAELRDAVTGGTHPATVVSPAGEFASYAGTRWEYTAQSYEAAGTLFGRRTGEVLVARAAALGPWSPSGAARFEGAGPGLPLRLGARGETKKSKPNALCADLELHGSALAELRRKGRPELRVERVGATLRIRASFEGRRPDRPVWEGPCATAGLGVARSSFVPFVLPNGLVCDDRSIEALVWADVRAARTRWLVELRLHARDPIDLAAVALYLHPAVVTAPGGLDREGLFACAAP